MNMDTTVCTIFDSIYPINEKYCGGVVTHGSILFDEIIIKRWIQALYQKSTPINRIICY